MGKDLKEDHACCKACGAFGLAINIPRSWWIECPRLKCNARSSSRHTEQEAWVSWDELMSLMPARATRVLAAARRAFPEGKVQHERCDCPECVLRQALLYLTEEDIQEGERALNQFQGLTEREEGP
jgi:hypothetical protein